MRSDGSDGAAIVTDGRILRGEATRERVLDAAERLFGEAGYDAVSIRQIAKAADVTLGVVGFHAGSKFDLFMIVLQRRVAYLDTERRRRLATLLERPAPPSMRMVIDAYITPYLAIASRGDPQWRAYAALIARVAVDERWSAEIGALYDPVAREFITVLTRLYPDATPERLATGLTLSVASMLSFVATRTRLSVLSDTEDRGMPIAYRDLIVDFCAAGFEALAQE